MPDAIITAHRAGGAQNVSVSLSPMRGMITLRGDLSAHALRDICKALTGLGFPDKGGITCDDAGSGESALAWMSPDEVLLLLPHGDVSGALQRIASALSGTHHLAVDVSDARALLTVAGAPAREVIAKLAPADLHPDSYGPGQCRRTRLGQIAAAFWMRDDTTFEVICFRSVADYALRLLEASAEAGEVGYYIRHQA
jgi:sarcosine oxidase, subunit gamma